MLMMMMMIVMVLMNGRIFRLFAELRKEGMFYLTTHSTLAELRQVQKLFRLVDATRS